MQYKDYYKILGVDRKASVDEIKKAYRKLARKYHPDVSKERNAEDKFKEMGEAYEVLKAPEKRAAYDQLGSYQTGQSFRPPPDWEQAFTRGHRADYSKTDFSDLFSELFGGAGGMGGAQAGRSTRGRAMGVPGQTYEATVHISLEDAYRGTEITLELTVPEHTQDGIRRVPKNINVRIPKGVIDGQKLKVPGKGGPGINGGAHGDLFLNIVLHPHPLFKASDHDLILEVPITPWEAALGASIEIPTMDGNVRLKVKEGARAGQKFRLTGKGLPKPGGGHGDLYALLQIVTPTVLSSREKELFEELAQVSTFSPRAHFKGL
ncbi:MAG: DnaJ C-terminal domain-containing protein [Gammaproteobacteria bacterium]